MIDIKYLGVDGGGTKTSYLLINERGNVLAFSKGESIHYQQKGINGFKENVQKGIEEVCKQDNCVISDIDYGFFGLPAFGEDIKMSTKMENIIKNIMPKNNFDCGNDVEVGWAGSLACKPGINIVAGTGAIGFGKDKYDNSARSSGWGYFCGDEGSAYWLGKKMISLFSKEADGRYQKLALYRLIKNKFDLQRDFDFISIIHNEIGIERDKIAGLAPLLSEAAKKGDYYAKDIFREAAYEHNLTVKAVIKKLDFEDIIDVSYSGGVFKAGNLILEPLKEFLVKENINLFEPKLLPVSGAALYAYIIHSKNEKIISYNDKNYETIVKNLHHNEDNFI